MCLIEKKRKLTPWKKEETDANLAQASRPR
jgi:hypothetical protein